MDAREREAVAVATAAAIGEINDTVETVSRMIRGRIAKGLKPLGPAGSSSAALVDTTHTGVHAAIRATAKVGGPAAGSLLRHTTDPDAPSLRDSPRGSAWLAGFGAAFGDKLPAALAPEMSVRISDGEATDHVAVFIHGLGGHDEQFSPTYLAAMSGYSGAYVRYTTGHAIASNGADLTRALESLVQAWPVEIRRLVIVGHSMGGLVTASAFQEASPDAAWPALVSDVVTLGTPHSGSPVERLSDQALQLLARVRAMEPIVALGHHRSQGIKDLGPGLDAPLPAAIRHTAVVASVGKSQSSVISQLIGDGLVQPHSARGNSPNLRVVQLPQSRHLAALNHPRVAELLAELAQTPPSADPPE